MSRQGAHFRREYRRMLELRQWVQDRTHDGKTDPWDLAAKRQQLEQWEAELAERRDPDLPVVRTCVAKRNVTG
jgi:hypothetical protein